MESSQNCSDKTGWKNIDTQTSFVPIQNTAHRYPAACEDACYDLDIEPDDIEVADTVTVVWEIA